MYSSALLLALSSALFQGSNGAPTPVQSESDLEERGLLSGLPTGTLATVVSELNSLQTTATGTANYASALVAIEKCSPTTSPTAVTQALSSLSAIYEATPTPSNLYAAIAMQVDEGLVTGDVVELLTSVDGVLSGENSMVNVNLKSPSITVYPKANASDAPYDLTEAQLREVIYIPSTFKYGAAGAPQPVILMPGTGSTGYLNFVGNYIPLLQGSSIGDPVWLNIPVSFYVNET